MMVYLKNGKLSKNAFDSDKILILNNLNYTDAALQLLAQKDYKNLKKLLDNSSDKLEVGDLKKLFKDF